MISNLRQTLNHLLTLGVVLFLISFTAATIQWYRINDTWVETYLFPVATDYSFTDWRLEPDGAWSAVVYLNKVRGECMYIKDQIETVLGTHPDGSVEESTISYIGDLTPGNNRKTGFQRLDDRLKIDKPSFIKGTVFKGSILHVCSPGRHTVTEFGPFIVGVDSGNPTAVSNAPAH